MTFLQRFASIILTVALAVAVAAGAWWLISNPQSKAKDDKHASAATVEKVVKETDLNTVTLTQEAETKLGLTVGTIERKPVRRVRIYGGEVAVPVGRAILVASPLTGLLTTPSSEVPKAGQPVKRGQTIFNLVPMMSPEGRVTISASLVEAEGLVNNAKAQLILAEIALDRAKNVLAKGAGSQRQVDEAQAAFDVASKTLDAVKARKATLDKAMGTSEDGSPTPITIDAPEDGILRTVTALPNQTVPQGAALFEIVDLSTLWVRVPLPVGDLRSIDPDATVNVGKLAGEPDGSAISANPIVAPPSANMLNATVDLFYELPNDDGTFTPGQRLSVQIPLIGDDEGLTVPWSAIVFDVYGGTWVYQQTQPHVYVRQRVSVKYTLDDDAVLAEGPPADATIVTLGVQELFGAETGFIK